jgi:hypothetical protein
MLDAVLKGRSQCKVANLREDELTSAIFSPLKYMPPPDALVIVSGICDLEFGLSEGIKDCRASFEFWRRKRALSRLGNVEPDCVFTFFDISPPIFINGRKSESVQFIFEVKWESGLSGDDQLVAQWEAFGCDYADWTYHVYLARTKQVAEEGCGKSRRASPDQKWHLIPVSWREVLERVKSIVEMGSVNSIAGSQRWFEDISCLMKQRGLSVFSGYDRLLEGRMEFDQPIPNFWRAVVPTQRSI